MPPLSRLDLTETQQRALAVLRRRWRRTRDQERAVFVQGSLFDGRRVPGVSRRTLVALEREGWVQLQPVGRSCTVMPGDV